MFARRSARVSPRWGRTRPRPLEERLDRQPPPAGRARAASSSAGLAPRQPTRSPSPGTNASASTAGLGTVSDDELGGQARDPPEPALLPGRDERTAGAVVGDRGAGGGEGEPPAGALPAPLHRPGGRAAAARAQRAPQDEQAARGRSAQRSSSPRPQARQRSGSRTPSSGAADVHPCVDSAPRRARTVPASCQARATTDSPLAAER